MIHLAATIKNRRKEDKTQYECHNSNIVGSIKRKSDQSPSNYRSIAFFIFSDAVDTWTEIRLIDRNTK